MVGPLKKRGQKLVYHRGKGTYSVYSSARDRKKRSTKRLNKWPLDKRKKYKHTSD